MKLLNGLTRKMQELETCIDYQSYMHLRHLEEKHDESIRQMARMRKEIPRLIRELETLTKHLKQFAEQSAKIEADAPKVLFADAVVGSIIPAGTPVVIGVTHDDIQIFSSGNTLTVVTEGEVDIDELMKRMNGECQPIYLCDIKGFQKSRGGFFKRLLGK